MKAAVAILIGLAAGLFTYDVVWAVIREQMRWTTINSLIDAAEWQVEVPQFAQIVFSAPAVLLLVVPAIIFYLLVVWLDFT